MQKLPIDGAILKGEKKPVHEKYYIKHYTTEVYQIVVTKSIIDGGDKTWNYLKYRHSL